jgi:hypothetical protein
MEVFKQDPLRNFHARLHAYTPRPVTSLNTTTITTITKIT